jgi:ABC-type amino acid transport substrate-binding protein
VITDTRAATFADDRGFRSRPFTTLEAAAAALREERADALLHDAPILQHFARANPDSRLEVLDERLVRDLYAFALPDDSPLHDDVNVALLSALLTPEWTDIRNRHLGSLESPHGR